MGEVRRGIKEEGLQTLQPERAIPLPQQPHLRRQYAVGILQARRGQHPHGPLRQGPAGVRDLPRYEGRCHLYRLGADRPCGGLGVHARWHGAHGPGGEPQEMSPSGYLSWVFVCQKFRVGPQGFTHRTVMENPSIRSN